MDPKLSHTGNTNEDRAAFIRHFVDYVEREKRPHESKVRRQIKTAAFQALSAEQKHALRDSKPDYRYIWDLIPSMLAGEDLVTSPAYECWEAALNTGKMVADSMTRQNIEDCIKLLRIREYKERVSEQLRVQFLTPTKDKLKNDAESWALTLQQELTRRVNCVCSCYEARRKDFKKKEPAAPAGEEAPKKLTREAHNAERANHSYNKVPPPDAKRGTHLRH
ncbi:hypothetical protein CYMTET_19688 [Cymbomonas tetramitiformis]|uniref:Uncharacterized protein n=1 Tax=Cymbomonas tetramitiformis TaxID=36881 RepID=A0AAE0G633_9CHLO|nr:hypothetical protein CYMTET_19688 [Cymbomonas tetramitiformis]